MKKLLTILMCLVMCFALCACGGEREDSPYEKVENAARSYVSVEVYIDYGYQPAINITSCQDNGDNTYNVSGNVFVNATDGTYKGTFYALVEYNPQTKKASTEDCEISKLYKGGF